MSTLLNDIKFSARSLLKSPSFTFIAILTLALGIGANTAIFSVVHAVLLDPFPYRDHSRLFVLRQHQPQAGIAERRAHSGPEFLAYKQNARSFEQLALTETITRNITVGGAEPERIFGAKVTGEFFPMLGVPPLHGRSFRPGEEGPAAGNLLVIGHGFWQRRFGSDPAVIGRNVELDGEPYTIVGVMPTRFRYLDTEFWFPVPFDLNAPPRSQRWYGVLGRLKSGVTPDQANAELEVIARRLEQDFAASTPEYRNWRISVLPLLDSVLGDVRPAVLILFYAVGFVLLIACANVANLMMARTVSRQQEIAVRAALGAGRSRLLRQFLTESALLAFSAGILGLLLAAWGVDLLTRLIPAGNLLPGGGLPTESSVRLSPMVLLFTLGVSLFTVFLFGVWPALQASRADINEVLREGTQRTTTGTRRLRARNLLAVTEIALALVLLIGSALLTQSFLRLMRLDPGIRTTDVISSRINLPPAKYRDNAMKAQFFTQLAEKTSALPGVLSTAVASHPPLSFPEDWPFLLEGGNPDGTREPIRTGTRTVSPSYHSTLGIPLLRGRAFTADDTADKPYVAIVNQTMARTFWPNDDAVGKRLQLAIPNLPPHLFTVVGVVGDSAQTPDLQARVAPEINFSLAQMSGVYRRMNLLVRAQGDPNAVVPAIRSAVWELDPQLPIYQVGTLNEFVTSAVAPRRIAMQLLTAAAVVALFIAMAGIYGVISYTVSRRTHEFGIRMALGAQQENILRLVLRQGMTLALTGAALGTLAALVLTGVLSNLLYGITATDPLTFIGIAILITGVALLACYIPARRATHTDPLSALRYE